MLIKNDFLVRSIDSSLPYQVKLVLVLVPLSHGRWYKGGRAPSQFKFSNSEIFNLAIGVTNIIALMSHASFLHSFGNSSTATRQLAQEGTTAEDPAIDHFELICDRIPIENFARSIVFRCTHCFYGLSSLEFNVGEARLHLSTCGECKTTDPNLCRRFAHEIEALEFASSLCLPISLNGSSLLSHSVSNSFHSKSNPQPSGKE